MKTETSKNTYAVNICGFDSSTGRFTKIAQTEIFKYKRAAQILFREHIRKTKGCYPGIICKEVKYLIELVDCRDGSNKRLDHFYTEGLSR